ncbi:MAG: hypothetical protein A2289_07130 [Deltaproteobacteria bacterium RIFOXYA12_FULL_58_15]|nr:MAG: hypothetical protein A2289_07130 [Deltaproteobacteria bacterium RIFOXYA12_FULL_58_15]
MTIEKTHGGQSSAVELSTTTEPENTSSCCWASTNKAPDKEPIIANPPSKDVAGTTLTKVQQSKLIDEPKDEDSKKLKHKHNDNRLPCRERYEQMCEEMKTLNEYKQARLVRRFVQSLSAQEQAELPIEIENDLLWILMRSMLREVDETGSKSTSYELSEEAIQTLYAVATTQPAFEKQNKHRALDIAAQLNGDGFIDGAKNNWKSMSPTARIEALTTIANRTAHQFGLPNVELVPYEEKKRRSKVVGQFSQDKILINTRGDWMDDFREVFNTVVHEVCHAYQAQLVEKSMADGMTSSHPDFQQVFAFWLNWQVYMPASRQSSEHRQYRMQPLEAYAWSTADIIVEAALAGNK